MEKNLNELFTDFGRGNIDRRELLTKLLAIPGGVAATGLSLPLLNSRLANAQPGGGSSPYDTADRGWRWARVRRLMREEGLDCLVIPSARGDGVNLLQFAEYISNAAFRTQGAVIFPLEGEPAIVGALNSPWISESSPKWFEGGEQLPVGGIIAEYISDMGHSRDRIGVVGTQANVEGLNEFLNEGLVTYATWSDVLGALPNATFVDITSQLAQLMIIKSPKEQENIRAAAQAGERFQEMLLAEARIGVDSKVLRAKIAEHFLLNDVRSDVQALELAPGRIRDGQLLNSEFGIIYSGGYAQVTLCLAFGTVSEQTKRLAEVAHASLDYGIEHLKPGTTFGEVIAGMDNLVSEAGFWHGFPQIHNVLPMIMVGSVYDRPPPAQGSKVVGADIEIREGMAFSFEPGARAGFGPGSGQVKVGATALITNDGIEVLNQIGRRMHVV